MASKRKRDTELGSTGAERPGSSSLRQQKVINRPLAGTKAYTTGQGVKDGLKSGSVDAVVALHQQILTSYSRLPLPIAHPSVVILQHYLEVSPVAEEVFDAWQRGDRNKEDRLAELSIALLAQIIAILTPLPFFRSGLLGIITKLCNHAEGWGDSLNRFLQSSKRDELHAALSLLAAAMDVDPPELAAGVGSAGTGGRLGLRVWALVAEGGGVKALGKTFGMRRRNKDGLADYGTRDPLDRPDIRHLAIRFVLPVLSSPSFHTHAKFIMSGIYSHLASDPPITVYRVLNAIWTAITASTPGISRRIALILLNENSLESLLGLVHRQEVEVSTGHTVGEIVSGFLEGVTTDPGRGVCFPDEGWYPRQVDEKLDEDEDDDRPGRRNDKERHSLHNRILSNVVRKTGGKVVDGDGKLGQMVANILRACPELVAGYWAHSGLALDPKLSARWMATMGYIGRIISLPPPSVDKFRQPAPRESDAFMPFRVAPPSVSTMIESILPAPLNKNHLTKGLQHSDGMVRHMTAVTLARALQKLEVVQDLLQSIEKEVVAQPSGSKENDWSRARRDLELEARQRVPEVVVVIGFAQKAAQLAPVEPETDEEKSLAAKSALLTEAALRLFGLYYRTMPSISNEAKFDVGRLLVSSSSAKAEKKERQALKTGSVADDTGSIASFGTAGTAGMGGGFGQSRGQVQGFEALSQVHVLELLREVKDWPWSNKAAASQYTYLYHILQLHLNTQFPLTRSLTNSLLRNLLEPTLLFEHDPSELDIWLSALIYSDPSISGASLTIQQIHLLSFLDDCFRRASKASYKYIEDLIALVPNYFSFARPETMISCVLMTMLEQLKAKILGQHIATEAAWVVLCYLRRVLIGLAGKLNDRTVLDAVVQSLEEVLKVAKEAGQERKGLKAVVKGMKRDIQGVYGGKAVKQAATSETPSLVDEGLWTARSFERSLLESKFDSSLKLVENTSDQSKLRHLQFVLHLLPHSSERTSLLKVLQTCLASIQQEMIRSRAKALLFESEVMQTLLLSSEGEQSRSVLNQLVASLSPLEISDRMLSAVYVQRCLELVQSPNRSELPNALTLFSPWIDFVSPDEAKSALSVVAKNAAKIPSTATQAKEAISKLVVATKDAVFTVDILDDLITLNIVTPITDLLLSFSAEIDRQVIKVDEKAIRRMHLEDEDNLRLLAALIEVSPKASVTVQAMLHEKPQYLETSEILPVIRLIMDLPKAFRKPLDIQIIVKTALSALTISKYSSAAISILASLDDDDAVLLETGLRELRLDHYTIEHVKLARALYEADASGSRGAVARLQSLGLEVVVRRCSAAGDLSLEDGLLIDELATMLQGAPDLELPLHLVEPVITATVTDRLDNESALRLAAILVKRHTLKASSVRQHLQEMFSSPEYTKFSGPSASHEAKTLFITLLHSLFHASTYVSCQPNFVEPLLPLYRGTMSLPDRLILDLLQTFEGVRRISVASILRRWSSSGLPGSGRTLDALTSLEPAKIMLTCTAFPLRYSLGGPVDQIASTSKEAMYDPVFVMSLFGAVLAEKGLSGLEWVEVLRSGVLGVVVCALSSRDQGMRDLASWLLGKTFQAISDTAFMERPQLLYTLRLLRHSIPAPESSATGNIKTPRIPTVITSFIAQTIRYQTNPAHFLYPLTSRFLLQRPVLDVKDVPMLYTTLYATGDGWKKERGWIVRFLRDAVRSEADWRILRRRHTWDLLATLFHISLDIAFRRLVLQALESFSRIPLAAKTLTHRSHLLIWLHTEWALTIHQPNKAAEEERAAFLRIIENLVVVLVPAEVARQSESSSSEVNDPASTSGEKELPQSITSQKEDDTGAALVAEVPSPHREKRIGWVGDVDKLLRAAVESPEIDASRLGTLARIQLRIAPLSLNTNTFLLLLDRTTKYTDNDAGLDLPHDARAELDTALEHLFRASLYLSPKPIDVIGEKGEEIQGKLRDLGKRVAGIGAQSEVGAWIRKERRLMRWSGAEEGKR